ncbi:MAG: TetR family transcriptional regulator [Streptosporangiales bacterium]|nr:TetR family transcriptional regulator [Streptosporangiales bacterium]
MNADRTSAGDPARTLELLWRRGMDESPRRGPRPRLTIERVVRTAIEIADGEGLDAVTMRRLAAALGVAPMTLYCYVPSRTELIDLMLDEVYLRMPRTEIRGEDWRSGLKRIADENRALYRSHPWAAEVATSRPPLGPGQMAKYEHELLALDGIGLDDVTMDSALGLVVGFVRANAREAVEAESARRDSGVSDREWWDANAPLLAERVTPSSYPIATRVGSAAGEAYDAAVSPDAAYEFGIQRILDGIQPLVDGRARS